MGVPVISLQGRPHASRVGADILQAIGRTDLIAATEDEYIDIVMRLVHAGPRGTRAREALRNQFLTSPLCDAARLVRNLERAYEEALPHD